MQNEKGKYMYCVIRNPESFDLDFCGIGGEKIHLVTAGKLAVAVSNAPIQDYPITRENTVTHQQAIEEIMRGYSPILPISFGTVAESSALIKEKMLRAKQAELIDALGAVAGKVELNLKAIWLDMPAVFRRVAAANPELSQLKKNLAGRTVGRNEAIEIGKLIADGLAAKKEQIRNEILAMLEDITVDYKDTQLLGEQMIFNLALLVPENKQKAFDHTIRDLDEKYKEENAYFKYIGPTPPFNFIKVSLSFI